MELLGFNPSGLNLQTNKKTVGTSVLDAYAKVGCIELVRPIHFYFPFVLKRIPIVITFTFVFLLPT